MIASLLRIFAAVQRVRFNLGAVSRRAAGFALLVLALPMVSVAQTRVNFAKYQRAISSSQQSSFDPEFAVDGLVSNFHSFRTANAAGPHWLELTLPLPVTIGSAQLFLGELLGATPTLVPANFKLQYHNGLSWSDIAGTVVTANTATEVTLNFTTAITADRFRFHCTDTGVRAVREWALYPPNVSGGVEQGQPLGADLRLNLAYLRPATASSAVLTNIYGAGYAKNAFDGYFDNASRWICTSTAAGEYIEVDLGDTQRLGSAHVHSGLIDPASTTRVAGAALASFKLQAWDDTAAAWTDIAGTSVTNNTQPSLALEFTTPVVTSKVRLVTTAALPGRLFELLLFPPRAGGYTLGREIINAVRPAATWETYSDSFHRLNSAATGLRLAVVDGQVIYGATSTTTAAESEWQLLLNYRDGSYRIRHGATGRCLALATASPATGTAVALQDYTGLPHQDWLLVADPAAPTRLRLVNVYSGYALQTAGAATTAGSTAIVDTAVDGRTVQQWTVQLVRHHPKKGIAGTASVISASSDVTKRYTTDPTLSFLRDFYDRLGGAWSYSWGRQTSDTFPFMDASHTFNPMQWGNGNNNFVRDSANPGQGPIDRNLVDLQSSGKPMLLMGANEPDRPEQGNVTVEALIARWPRLEALQAPLVGPCPADPDGTWQADFYAQANARGYRRDYTPVHWYAAPNASSLISVLQSVYNTYGRPVWLTEFSTVRWSGTGTWTDADNYNFLAEFMWRAEGLTWLKRYSLFVFVEGSGTISNGNNIDPTEAPRSNTVRADGSLTAFGELYAGWDGVAAVVNHRSYHMHNRGGYQRAHNPGGTAAPALLSPETASAGTQWFLTPGTTANTVRIISTRDGRPLRTANGTAVTFGTAGQSDTSVEWRLVAADTAGWYFIEHPATSKRLKDNGAAYTLEALTQTADRFKWRLVRPAVADPAGPPEAPASLLATTTSASVTLDWPAATNATTYLVQRASAASGPWTTMASGVTATEWIDTGVTPLTTYYYQVLATNLSALLSAPSPVVAATPPTAYAEWASANLAALPTDAQLPAADPDRDGLPNLLEFALGTAPTASSTGALNSSVSGDGRLQLTFQRARSDVTYEVQASADLVTWTTIATNPGTVGTSVTVADTVTVASATRRFLRLRVTN